jgi:hypothetical protein
VRCLSHFFTGLLGRSVGLIGNERANRAVHNIIRLPGAPPKTFLAGPTGSGKTTVLNNAFAWRVCVQPQGNKPCGQCDECKDFRPGYSQAGFFVRNYDVKGVPVNHLVINCRNITAPAIDRCLEQLRGIDGIRLIHLEEAANLKRLQCDESLTDVMDDPDFATCHWFATAVTDFGLAPQFRRRWTVKLKTSPPTVHEAACFLAQRCREHKITVDHPKTLNLLAQRSWCVIGLALAPLSAAIAEGNGLTYEFVQDYPLPGANPWDQEFFET